MRFLATYKGALVVVSHDLSLLDASITRILHLGRDGVIEYRGTYREYREARRLDEVRLGKLAERQRHEIQRLRTLADSMRGQAPMHDLREVFDMVTKQTEPDLDSWNKPEDRQRRRSRN